MRVCTHDITQRVLLFRRKVRRVSLGEHEQALVPEHGQLSLGVRVREPNKVEHEGVEDFVRQSVFLV